MAKYFGDIAKGCKDILSGGISYDNKFNVSTKVAGQVRRTTRPAGRPRRSALIARPVSRRSPAKLLPRSRAKSVALFRKT